MDALQSFKVQALPVGGVNAVDVADASSQEVNAQSGDLGALFGVSDFAVADYAVLNAADGTNFGFDDRPLSCASSTSSRVLAMFSSMG